MTLDDVERPKRSLAEKIVLRSPPDWKSRKLIARTIIYIYTFALRSPKAIHLLPWEHGEIWGRLEVGWEKVACWSTKPAISLKHVKIAETLLRRAYIGTHQRSFEQYHPDPLRPPLPQDWGVRNRHPKLQSLLSQETGKATDFKFGRYIHRIHPKKANLKFWRKGNVPTWAYPGTAQSSKIPPIISGTGKATNFKFCMHTHRIDRNKSQLKISGKVVVGVLRDSRKCSGLH